MLCQKCGQIIPDDSEYCQYCGVRLDLPRTGGAAFAVFDSAPHFEESTAKNTDIKDGERSSSAAPAAKKVENGGQSKERLIIKAYNSYLSSDPEERKYFDGLLGSTELRAAYLEEFDRVNGEKYDQIRFSYKRSYIEFMTLLHEQYFGSPAFAAGDSAENGSGPQSPTDRPKKDASGGRFHCRFCGHAVENPLKACPVCGKRSVRSKPVLLCVVLPIVLLLLGYAAYASFINTGPHYTKARKAELYSAGQSAYRSKNLDEAEKLFKEIMDYKRSADYLLLIRSSSIKVSSISAEKELYNDLFPLLEFENTADIIAGDHYLLEYFLNGLWEDGSLLDPYYIELRFEPEKAVNIWYNLPHNHAAGGWFISDAVFYSGSSSAGSIANFKFTIIDKDTISVYCYADGSTHRLYRQ